MQVGLMNPGYVELFYPEVSVATLEFLEKLRVDIVSSDMSCIMLIFDHGFGSKHLRRRTKKSVVSGGKT